MTGFDPERYLRLTGEQWVGNGGSAAGFPCNPVLVATAAALVAVDAITIADAQAIIDDYFPAPASGDDRRHLTSGQAARSVASALPDVGQLWIELVGERVELTAESAGTEAWTERVPAADPAVRHLWERVATLNDFHDPHLALDATITTLVAAGALQPDDSVIGAARAVLTVLRPDGAVPAGGRIGPPEPWQSLLARWGQTGGPVGTIKVGAITPSFDGVTAAVVALQSRDEHFGIKVGLVPGVRTGLPYCDLPDRQHLTWWAVDNLGHHYLGEQGSWDPRDDRCQGSIGFWPALHTRASSIDLVPTATATRAVIRVPLPWAEHQ
jgi:hypothetical protein